MLERTGQSRLVQLGLQTEMIQPGHTPTSLQLHERDDAGKEMIRLRPHPLGGRSGKGCVALETLVVLFDLPPFLVKRPKRRSRQRQVTRVSCPLFMYQRLLQSLPRVDSPLLPAPPPLSPAQIRQTPGLPPPSKSPTRPRTRRAFGTRGYCAAAPH